MFVLYKRRVVRDAYTYPWHIEKKFKYKKDITVYLEKYGTKFAEYKVVKDGRNADT